MVFKSISYSVKTFPLFQHQQKAKYFKGNIPASFNEFRN